jgi:hypothetical protein
MDILIQIEMEVFLIERALQYVVSVWGQAMISWKSRKKSSISLSMAEA